MKRIKTPSETNNNSFPDIKNFTASKNFTMMPNELLRSPDISSKAVKLFGILVSNEEGWKNYVPDLCNKMKEGETSIHNALKELEENGYILRVQIREITTKKRRDSFMILTDVPFSFHLEKSTFESIKNRGLELYYKSYNLGSYNIGTYNIGFGVYKNTNKENKRKEEKAFFSIMENLPKEYSNNETLQKIISDYVIHRKQKGSSLTAVAISRLSSKLSKHSITECIHALERSVENGWTGVFFNGESNKPINGHSAGSRSTFKKTNYKKADQIL